MGEMREIVDVGAVGRLFAVLAVMLPVVGALVGAVWGRRRGDVRRGTLMGFAVGCIGIVNELMWLLYNALTERNGLDSVRNVVVNLILFVAVGLGIGALAGRVMRGRAAKGSA